VVSALQYNGDVGNIMIGPDYCTTIKEVAEIIISHPKVNTNEIEYDLTKPIGDLGRFADYSVAKSELNWSPSVSFKSGIYDLIDYIYAYSNK
jgi:nucleoside-diphosphate-sugar epimerase